MPELMPAPAPTPAPVAASASPDSRKPIQTTESTGDDSDFSGLLNDQAGISKATTTPPPADPSKATAATMGEDLPVADGKPLPELLTLPLALPPQQEPLSLNSGQATTAVEMAGEGLAQRMAALLRQFDREAGPRELRGRVGEIVSDMAAQARDAEGDAVTKAVRQALTSLQEALPRAGELRPVAERLVAGMEQLLRTRASLQPAVLATADAPDVAASLPATTAPMTAPAAQATPAATTTALPSTQVTVPLQQSGWDQAIGERVLWMVNQKLQGAEIRLNPPHLGPIEVRVQLHQDQAQVNFTAQHAVVREALEAALPRLRDMFQSQGVALVNVDVSDRSLAEQRERADAEGQAARAAVGIDDDLSDGDEGSVAILRTLPPDRAIDLFV